MLSGQFLRAAELKTCNGDEKIKRKENTMLNMFAKVIFNRRCYYSSASNPSVKAADEYRYIKHFMRLITRFNEPLSGLDFVCFVALEGLCYLLRLQLRIVLLLRLKLEASRPS
jgi:hypothetical protein